MAPQVVSPRDGHGFHSKRCDNDQAPLTEPATGPVEAAEGEEEEEDDYMTMSLPTGTEPTRRSETYTQKRQRQQRESEARGRTKSKHELEEERRTARELAMSTSLLADPEAAAKSKGLKMMAKMGFKAGTALGKKREAEEDADAQGTGGEPRLEPLVVKVKEGRGGIGLEAERKRILREEGERLQSEAKRVKVDEGDYRERMRLEREAERLERLVINAMKVAESVNAEREEEVEEQSSDHGAEGAMRAKKRTISTKPLRSINVLWRGLIRHREEKERDRRMRHDLMLTAATRLPTYVDEDEETDDKLALGQGESAMSRLAVEDLDKEDVELESFNALQPAERLQKLVAHLRAKHYYCFWCKCAYPDVTMDGCPGNTEEDHE